MADSTRGELETELAKHYPEKAQVWLATFTAPHRTVTNVWFNSDSPGNSGDTILTENL
jgi:hypothetical protein